MPKIPEAADAGPRTHSFPPGVARRRFLAASAGLALAGLAGTAAADTWPSRPVHIIVPFAPGGPADILARLVGSRLSDTWGQPVVVDNRPGAAGIIGAEVVAKSPPDGYTLLLSNMSDAVSVTLYPKLPYDLVRDFKPITPIAMTSFILAVHPSLKANSVAELIALARAEPGKLAFASSGSGTLSHLAGEIMKSMADIDMLHVPYKGQSPATNDVLAGRVPLTFTNTMVGLPFVRSGKLRALAVSPIRRIAVAPDIPTVAESGLPGFDVAPWFGLHAPAGTPDDIVRRVAADVDAALKVPEIAGRLKAMGAEPAAETPQAFDARVRSDIEKWGRAVKSSGAHPD
jgi:tripartite-type tricarboxylate transporter receptor subunit TctC